MFLEKMNTPFAITYRFHWCGPCLQYEDTKEETTIKSDGSVVAKRFDHHGAKGRFRVIEKATAQISPEEAEELYAQLMDLVHKREGIGSAICDATEEIVLGEMGLKVTIDGGMSDGERYAGEMVKKLLSQIAFEWEPVAR